MGPTSTSSSSSSSRRRMAAAGEIRAAGKLARSLLSRALQELDHYVAEDGARVNPNRWRPLAARDALQLYREREHARPRANTGNTVADAQAPAVLVSGRVRGRVETAVNAASSDSLEHLALLNAFLFGDDVVDSDVVAAFQASGATAEDQPAANNAAIASQPTFFGVKALTKSVKTPRDPIEVKCEYVEHRGYSRSKLTDELVGFYAIVPIIERQRCGQARTTLRRQPKAPTDPLLQESACCLFRQVNDEIVEVFLLATIDPSADSAQATTTPVSVLVTPDSVFGMAGLLDCAEAKILTIMHRQNQQTVQRTQTAKPTECSMCRQKKRLFFGSSSSFTACEVCGNYVCSRCRIDKRVFMPRQVGGGGSGGGSFEKISACKPCSMAASSGPATGNALDAPVMVLSERVRMNRAKSKIDTSGSKSSQRSRTTSSGSSGSTTSSVGMRLVYYEDGNRTRSRTDSNASMMGLRKMSMSSNCTTPRSASGSVPPSPMNQRFGDRAPEYHSRDRRESFDGMVPTTRPSSSSSATPRTYTARPIKERARSEDYVQAQPATTVRVTKNRSSRELQAQPRDHERFPCYFTPQLPAGGRGRSRTRDQEPQTSMGFSARHDAAPSQMVVASRRPAYNEYHGPSSQQSAPSGTSRSASPNDLMARMMELRKLADLSYDTTQHNNTLMAQHLRSR